MHLSQGYFGLTPALAATRFRITVVPSPEAEGYSCQQDNCNRKCDTALLNAPERLIGTDPKEIRAKQALYVAREVGID